MGSNRRTFAAGRWPSGFYIELVDGDAQGGYPPMEERIYVGDQRVGEALEELEEGFQEGTPRLAYEHHGDIRCGWCDRPLEECRTDPCDHYDN